MVEYGPFDHSVHCSAVYRELPDEGPVHYKLAPDFYALSRNDDVARQYSSNVRGLHNLPIMLAA